MRKSKKTELCNCIHTLMTAHRKMNMSNAAARAEILPQCQEMAIMVGTTIEQIEGEGTRAVSCLEEYCEALYESSLVPDQAGWKTSSKKMEKLLKSVEHNIRYGLPDSPGEIVFMPYKAAMWDALDSVYRAAVQEGNCHVVVMPIPYYNADRKRQQVDMYYEGGLFPEDIPITDYRTYDLEKEQPDVIFIHNPYDNGNYVTQVPQEYFSSELIKHTDHLVYIPYFITKGDKVNEVAHCVMPAVRNAWRTFVQSEGVRKSYIENGADPDKVVAMGSPKFDMVIRMQENPPGIPEEWKDALSGRKIFLLNTHLNPIINEAEKQLDKLHQIFELFRQRGDVALLWRPHPLSIETARAMNPQMLDDYLHIIGEFKTLSIGVYDETPDVHRAIALSDAYVGDWSSLVTLYGITGKQMYLMSTSADTHIFSTEDEFCLRFSCGVLVDGVLWAPAVDHNGLYRIDTTENTARYVTCMQEESTGDKELYHRIIHYKGKLFLIPWKAKAIAMYDTVSGQIEYLVPDYDAVYGLPKFSEAIQYGNYLYLFPAFTPNIVCLNMDNGEMKHYRDCCQQIEDLKEERDTFVYGSRLGDKAWIASWSSNCFVEYDLGNNDYNIHFLEESKEALVDIANDGQKTLYILNVYGEVFQWDMETRQESLIWRNDHTAGGISFARIIYVSGQLWLLPLHENKIVRICLKEDVEAEEYKLPDSFRTLMGGTTKTIGYILSDNKVFSCPVVSNGAIEIDCDLRSLSLKKINYDGLERLHGLMGYRMHDVTVNDIYKYIYRETSCSLESFLKIVVSENDDYETERKDIFAGMQANANGKCGEKIWRYVLSRLD